MDSTVQKYRSFYIENLGCSKNQVDAEIIISELESNGWTYSESPEEAELIIINTCGFIEAAKQESIDTTLSFRSVYRDKKILMAGCFAQRYGKDLLESFPEIDGVFGNKDLTKVAEAVETAVGGARTALLPSEGSAKPERHRLLSLPGTAYVKISEGCNHGCSYCAIPLIRGRLRSRTMEDVLGEIRQLLKSGVFEINLVAQDLAAFGTDRGKSEFSELLRKISALDGKFWIRMLYIHPDNFPAEILEIAASDERILPYFDIPFQHASGKVLSMMGRKGGKYEYLSLVSAIRKKLPEAVIRSTFMAAFPGEKRFDRKELIDFIINAELDWAGFFTYSREENTRAFKLRGPLFHRIAVSAVRRFVAGMETVQSGISRGRMERFAGRDLDVLIEEVIEGEPMSLGRAYLHAPEVDGAVVVLSDSYKPGTLVRCRILRSNGLDLEGQPVDEL